MKSQAKKIREKLAQSYSRDNWKEVLLDVFDGRIQLFGKEQFVDKSNDRVESFYQLGNIQLDDGRMIALYELKVADDVNVIRNRVMLNQFVSSTIEENIIDGVIAIFQNETEDYRLTFSSYGTDYDEKTDDFIEKSTDSKRYTYLLGENESCRTAAEQLHGISKKEELLLDDIEHAFNVDIVSKRFFDDYIKEFDRLVTFIKGKPTYFQAIFEKDETAARNFVKRFMGRLVFLKFVQKKGWLGVPLEEKGWERGDYGFLESRFRESGNKKYFLTSFLNPLFAALNTPDRENHAFEDYDFKVPYLSGGLFENENKEELRIDFDEELLEYLFDFFDRYNFTIDENDAMDREVGIDPEMLGHIFENLLEDNKDKGAFYTPKEIVRYMCQESLKEYLKTYLEKKQVWPQDSAQQEALENTIAAFVEKKETAVIARKHDKHIAQALKEVKICDPAIGSGAFPMGLLNEIFNLTKALHTESADAVGAVWNMVGKKWEPHKVKQNIIQHSIYGVDIEAGAVEIARLRFWLSLIIEEKEPKPLPHLEYKIVEGNSLISKLGDTIIDIEWEAAPEESQTNMFGAHEKVIQRQELLNQITALQKQIFEPDCDHDHLSLELRNRKIELLQLQLAIMVDKDGMVDKPQVGSKNFKKQTENWLKTKGWQKQIKQLEAMKNSQKTPLEFFDWKLDFPEVMNPEINPDAGFDIVIGNPPYGVSIKGEERISTVNIWGKVPDYEIYYFFIELARVLLNKQGTKSYIVPNTFLFNIFAEKYRINIVDKWELTEILDCTKFEIFNSATVRNTINLWKKKQGEIIGYRETNGVTCFKDLINNNNRKILPSASLANFSQNWALLFNLSPEVIDLVNRLKIGKNTLGYYFPEISQGLIAYDKYRGQSKEVIESRAFHYDEYKPGLKKWLKGADVTEYNLEWNGKHYLDYCDELANPRQPKFFKGLRILIREITNPKIFAVITSEELYNDPSLIIIKDHHLFSIRVLCAILNSRLLTFYHFNYSPKSTKGAFPKILIKDVKEFPLPSIDDLTKERIEGFVDQMTTSDTSVYKINQIDNLVYKLYNLTYEEALIIEPELSDRLTKEEYAAIEVE